MNAGKIKLFCPMLVPFLGLASGIALSPGSFWWIAGIGSSLILAAIIIAWVLMRKGKNPVMAFKTNRWNYLWVFLLFLGIGIVDMGFRRSPAPDPNLLKLECHFVTGRVLEVSSLTSGTRALIEMASLTSSDNSGYASYPYLVMVSGIQDSPEADDIVIFSNRLVPVASLEESGYTRRLKNKDVSYVCRLYGNDLFAVTGDASSLSGRVAKWRSLLEEKIEKSGLGRPTCAFLISILLGDRAFLDPDTRALFSDAGVSHILALSGMHIGIIASILFYILFPINYKGLYRWRYIIVIPLIWAYTLFTGMMPSTVRAAVMATFLFGGFLLERKNSSWNSLLAATFFILLFDPSAIRDVGLQLSFVCVASIILFADPLNPIGHHHHPRLYKFIAAILVSICATAASWTLTAWYFGIFPVAFLLANLIALPLLPLYISLAILYLLFSFCGISLPWFAYGLGAIYSDFLKLIAFINGNGSTVLSADIPAVTVILWIAALAVLALYLHSSRRKTIIGASAFCALCALVAIPVFAHEKESGFRFRTNAYNAAAVLTDEGGEREIVFDVNAISRLKYRDKNIVVADCPVDNLKSPINCDYLLITRSCTTPLPEILTHIHPDTLILHTSISRSRSALLQHQSDSLSLPSVCLR